MLASVPYWAQDEAITSFREHADLIDHVSVFWYHLGPDGQIRSYKRAQESRELIDLAHEHGAQVFALVANLPDDEREDHGGSWDPDRVERVIRTEEDRAAHIADLVDLSQRMAFDGIYIDYEALPSSYRGDFSRFIEELGDALHAEGKLLAVALHPKTSEDDPREDNGSHAQDWEHLHQHADQLHFMTYSQHTAATDPGPVADSGWVERVLRYAVEARRVPPGKIYMGLPLYAEEWQQVAPDQYRGLGTDLTFSDAQRRKRDHDGREMWSAEHESPYIVFHDDEDREHIIWFENARSSALKLSRAASLGVCNIAPWRFGGEDPGFWELLRDRGYAALDGAGAARDEGSGRDGEARSEGGVRISSTDTGDSSWRLWRGWDEGYPKVTGWGSGMLEYYTKFDATNPAHEREELMAFMRLEQDLELTSRLAIESALRLVFQSDGGDERFYSEFPYEGVYVRLLRLHYDADWYSFFAGKYEPASRLRGHAPIFFGNYSTNLVLDRRFGAGASLTLEREVIGRHTLTGHSFQLDTSRLSGEVITGQGRHRSSDGGVANTGWPSSYLLTLNGGTLGDGADFNYALGWGVQRNSEESAPDEQIYLGSLYGMAPVGEQGELWPSVGVMSLRNAYGQDDDIDSLLIGLEYARPSFSIGGAYSLRFVTPSDEEASRRMDVIAEIVASYAFGGSLSMQAAYQNIRERGESDNSFGVVFSYMFDWLLD